MIECLGFPRKCRRETNIILNEGRPVYTRKCYLYLYFIFDSFMENFKALVQYLILIYVTIN